MPCNGDAPRVDMIVHEDIKPSGLLVIKLVSAYTPFATGCSSGIGMSQLSNYKNCLSILLVYTLFPSGERACGVSVLGDGRLYEDSIATSIFVKKFIRF